MNKLVSIKNNDNIIMASKIYENNAPEKVYFENTLNFKINDYIYKNMDLGNNFASISGKVTNIFSYNNKSFMEITNDYQENMQNRLYKKKCHNKEELINLLSKYKLDNIVKKIKSIDNIKNIVISSIDEEIYTIKEFIRLENNYMEILETLDYLNKIILNKKSFLAVKNTNFNSIKNVKSIIGTYPKIKIILTPDKYLISYKPFLCNYLNLVKEETLLLSTNELYSIYNILNGKNNLEVLITLSGNATYKSIVINAKLGVLLKELMTEYLEFSENYYEVYKNGYFKGTLIKDIDNFYITNDIHFIEFRKIENKLVSPCINCGACIKICPFNINVKKCFQKNYASKKCIKCGLCNFICPSNIDLKSIVGSYDNEKENNN